MRRNSPKTRSFRYKLSDPPFNNSIGIDMNTCKTVLDLKKEIARFHLYPDSDLQVKNVSEKSLLETNPCSFFEISFQNRCTDIKFQLPAFTSITIQNCYKMNFKQIIDSFQTQHLYYSDDCKKHMKFLIKGKEVPHIEYPLLAVHNYTTVDFKVNHEVVILKYGYNNFIFIDTETASTASRFIQTIYRGCSRVSIRNSLTKKNLEFNDKLSNNKICSVKVFYSITFYTPDYRFSCTINLDFLSKVSDAKQQLANEIVINGRHLKPENFSIYNKHKKILDEYIYLKNVQKFNENFYYDIDKFALESIKRSSKNEKKKIHHRHSFDYFDSSNRDSFDSIISKHPHTPLHKFTSKASSPIHVNFENKIFSPPRSPKNVYRIGKNDYRQTFTNDPAQTNLKKGKSADPIRKSKENFRNDQRIRSSIDKTTNDNNNYNNDGLKTHHKKKHCNKYGTKYISDSDDDDDVDDDDIGSDNLSDSDDDSNDMHLRHSKNKKKKNDFRKNDFINAHYKKKKSIEYNSKNDHNYNNSNYDDKNYLNSDDDNDNLRTNTRKSISDSLNQKDDMKFPKPKNDNTENDLNKNHDPDSSNDNSNNNNNNKNSRTGDNDSNDDIDINVGVKNDDSMSNHFSDYNDIDEDELNEIIHKQNSSESEANKSKKSEQINQEDSFSSGKSKSSLNNDDPKINTKDEELSASMEKNSQSNSAQDLIFEEEEEINDLNANNDQINKQPNNDSYKVNLNEEEEEENSFILNNSSPNDIQIQIEEEEEVND